MPKKIDPAYRNQFLRIHLCGGAVTIFLYTYDYITGKYIMAALLVTRDENRVNHP